MHPKVELADEIITQLNDNIDSLNYDGIHDYIKQYKNAAEYIYYYMNIGNEDFDILSEHYEELDSLKQWLIDFYIDDPLDELNNDIKYVVELMYSILETNNR